MEDILNKINKLEKTVNENKIELGKLEERKENLEKEKAVILKELKEKDIDEENLEEKVVSLKEEIEKEVEKLENELS